MPKLVVPVHGRAGWSFIIRLVVLSPANLSAPRESAFIEKAEAVKQYKGLCWWGCYTSDTGVTVKYHLGS